MGAEGSGLRVKGLRSLALSLLAASCLAWGLSAEGLRGSGAEELLELPEMKADQQVQVGAEIPIEPTGYAVRIGKAVHGVLDVAAPLDANTGAAVPAIIKPDQPAKPSVHIHAEKGQPTYVDYHFPQPQPNIMMAQPSVTATAPIATQVFKQQAPKEGVQLRAEGGAKQQQLAQMEDEDSMYPMTESEEYAAEPTPTYHYIVQHQPTYVQPATAAPPAAGVVATMKAQAPQVVPNYFKAPFGEWSAEDSAQHAYNLAQWRVRILEAKLKQSKLRSELMKEGKIQTDDHFSYRRGHRGRYSDRESRNARRARLLYQSMDKMSHETGQTLKSIETQIGALARIEQKSMNKQQGVKSAMREQANEDYSEQEMRRFKKRTNHTLQAIMKKLKAIQTKVQWASDPARDAGAGSLGLSDSDPVSKGVEQQEKLWKKVSSDLQTH